MLINESLDLKDADLLQQLAAIKNKNDELLSLNNLLLESRNETDLALASIENINEKLKLVEMIELTDHPWFVGVQFHPELKSRVVKAHPLFANFIKAAIVNK